ncbi:hypothetical protein [Methanogenium organophilum]|uniref:Uncharacterized protein n=1 Tax=Methanogenium organophilum TaxID=2199 RepID=A0A9X9T935_METOG|nr:hypothetical protein [Methanogenium organophilum]WAI01752.1 hypothetical protein OU421_02440 [Methanogenium organophilum]
MKRIYVGLIACALLFAITCVAPVMSCEANYCKVNGGGQVYDEDIGDVTIAFHAQGPCTEDTNGADSEVKGQVTIVYHDTKEKLKLDVEKIIWCLDGGYYTNAVLSLEDGYALFVCDHGEGSKMVGDDHVCFANSQGDTIFCGILSGNAQVRLSEAT